MTPERITALIDATWPPESAQEVGHWTIRKGAGGGSRVSAATANPPNETNGIEAAEDAMRALGQVPLFMVRAGETALDSELETRGYQIKDPVSVYELPIANLTDTRPPPVTCFEVWPPLAVQEEIWAAGDVDAPRIAIMLRTPNPKTTILGRLEDTPAGTLFAAVHDGVAMVHAVETATEFRRKGLGAHMMRAAAFWGQDNGAHKLALLVTKANEGANALYSSLGMTPAAGYHYRVSPEE